MSANIKCYDPATGRVLFDLTKNTTRVLQTIDVPALASGSITIDEQGELFAFCLMQNIPPPSVEGLIPMSGLVIQRQNRTIIYRNIAKVSQTLIVGVIAI